MSRWFIHHGPDIFLTASHKHSVPVLCVSSTGTQHLQVWSRSGLKSTGFCGHLSSWPLELLNFILLFHFSKCQSHVRQASVTRDQVLSSAFIASLPLNSPDLLDGRYCKLPRQCLLQHFLINPVVLRHQKAENYISHTPLQVRSYMEWCPQAHTPAPD